MVSGFPHTKFVFARLKGNYNPAEFEKFKQQGALHKVEGHEHEEFLKRDLEKRHGITDAKDIYLIPLTKPLEYKAKLGMRTIYHTLTDGTVWQLKGTGINQGFQEVAKVGSRWIDKIKVKKRTYRIPYTEQYSGKIDGGLLEETIEDTINTYSKLMSGWRKFLQKEPEFAKNLHANIEEPYAHPIASFELLEIIGKRRKGKGTPYQRIPVRETKFSYLHPQVLLTKGHTTHIRVKEWTYSSKKEKLAEFAKIAPSYGFEEFNFNKKEDRAELHIRMVRRLAAMLYAARKYSKLAMHEDVNTLLDTKDFNGVQLWDTNGVDPATKENKEMDLRTLSTVARILGMTLELKDTHNAHQKAYEDPHIQTALKKIKPNIKPEDFMIYNH